MMTSRTIVAGGAIALLMSTPVTSATAESGNGDVSALTCAAAYQLDWQATTSPERSAADRAGAEKTLAAMSDTKDAGAAVAQQAAALEAQVGADSTRLAEIVEACDLAWSGNASEYATQYAPPPETSMTASAGIMTFENSQTEYSPQAPPAATSAECDTTERRATGIINTWTYAMEDYFAGGVRDYDQERELSDLYRRLRSRLEDELSVAETYSCEPLTREIRFVLGDWDNPF